MTVPLQNRLEEFRKMHDTKINKLCEVTGRKRGALRRYRLNQIQPSEEIAKKICTFYQITMQDLFYFPTSHEQQRSDRGVQDNTQD